MFIKIFNILREKFKKIFYKRQERKQKKRIEKILEEQDKKREEQIFEIKGITPILKEKLPIPKKQKEIWINSNIITEMIEGKKFIFDKEGYNEFKKNFCDDLHNIIVTKDGYLARKQRCKKGYTTFFHVWLMSEEIDRKKENFGGDIEVHHLWG